MERHKCRYITFRTETDGFFGMKISDAVVPQTESIPTVDREKSGINAANTLCKSRIRTTVAGMVDMLSVETYDITVFRIETVG